MTITIRTEGQQDFAQVRELLIQAFGNREDEAELVERIRLSAGFVPELSLVAELDGKIAGHVLLSKAEVCGEDGGRQEVLALAPVAVDPAYQKQGIDRRIIEESLRRGKELAFQAVLLIGHPSYYPRFGFKPARPYGLELKQFEVPDDVFMVAELQEHALDRLKGELQYPGAFLGEV